jgi:hypothetical protein
MSAGKKILLVVISIVLVISLFVLGILWSSYTFLYPEVYKETFEKTNFYDSVTLSQIPGGDFITLPEDGMKGILDNFIESTLSYLRGDSENLNLTFEVDSEKLDDFLLKESQKIRICNVGEESFLGKKPNCRPPELNASEYLEEILEKNSFTVPENKRVNIAGLLGFDVGNISKIRNYTISYKYLLYGLGIFILVLSLFLFFISETKTRWAGIDFLISGALVFSIGFLAFPLIIQSLSSGIGFIESASKNFLEILYSRLTIYSIAIGGIGIVGIALSFFINKKTK